MSRVLVATEKPGWYVDAAEPGGKKVRKQQDDQIFDNLLEAQEALAVLHKVNPPTSNGHGSEHEPKESAPVATKPKAEKPKPKAEKADKPKTVTIRCQWKEKGKRCTNERTIKVQDAFQVKFCEEHQKAHRRQMRSEKAKARTAAKRAEREKAKAKAAA